MSRFSAVYIDIKGLHESNSVTTEHRMQLFWQAKVMMRYYWLSLKAIGVTGFIHYAVEHADR